MRLNLFNITKLILILTLLRNHSYGQTIDQSFIPKVDALGNIYAAAQQADGKLIVAGYFDRFNGQPFSDIIRLNTDGSIDNNFNIGVGLKSNVGHRWIRHIKIQPDGKILVFGPFVSFNNVTCHNFIRLNTDGSVDQTFKAFSDVPDDNLVHGGSYPLALQSDGKIICVIGVSVNNVSNDVIARLNSDGSYDNTFQATVKGTIYDIQLQADGKVLFTGLFTEFNGTTVKNIVRTNANGTLENSFGSGADNVVYKAAVQTDGKILVGGTFSTFNGVSGSSLIRLNSDGSRDNGFVLGALSESFDMIIDNTGKIITAGYYGRVRRFNTNGSLDVAFTIGSDANDLIFKVLPLSNGQVFVAGRPNTVKKIFLKLNNDFTIDASFNPGIGPTTFGSVTKAARQSTGKIVLTGNFSYFNDVEATGIVRLNEDLSVDNTFNSGTGCFPPSNLFQDFAFCQNDDKIVFAGQFSKYNGTAVTGFIRLNSDGTLDNSFVSTPRNFLTYINSVAMQADGKVVVGTGGSGPSAKYISRYNTNGGLDLQFSPVVDATVGITAVQSDGKIVISGNFKNVNGVPINTKIVRLNSDGTTDNTFQPEPTVATANSIYSILPQADGRLITAGTFSVDTKFYSVRTLRSDGKMDSDFKSANDAIGGATGMFQLRDNSQLTRIGNKYVRLLPSGSLEQVTSELELTGSSEYFYGALSLTSTTFLVYGDFSKLGSVSVSGLAKVSVSALPAAPQSPTLLTYSLAIAGHPVLSWTDNSSSEQGFYVQRAECPGKNFVTIAKASNNATTWADQTAVSNVPYFYRIVAYNTGGPSLPSNEVSFQGIVTEIENVHSSISMHPNPCSDQLQLHFSDRTTRTVKVMDVRGISTMDIVTNEKDLVIQMNDRPSGVYCLQVLENNSIKFLKFIKQ